MTDQTKWKTKYPRDMAIATVTARLLSEPRSRQVGQNNSQVVDLRIGINPSGEEGRSILGTAQVWGKRGEHAMTLQKGEFLILSGSFDLKPWTHKQTGKENLEFVLNVESYKRAPRAVGEAQAKGTEEAAITSPPAGKSGPPARKSAAASVSDEGYDNEGAGPIPPF